jgi:hypothetical protein
MTFKEYLEQVGEINAHISRVGTGFEFAAAAVEFGLDGLTSFTEY